MGTLNANQLIKGAEDKKSARTPFERDWQRINKLIYPLGTGFGGDTALGASSHEAVLDNTAELASELLAAALHGMLTNPATKWFAIRAQNDKLNENERVAVWLEQVAGIMYSVFNSPRLNFAPQQHEKNMDLVNYGTGCMFIAEKNGEWPIFQTRALSEIYLGEDGEGRVDKVDRWFKLSAEQAVSKFKGNPGDKVAEFAASDDPKKRAHEFEFIHCTGPRTERDPGKGDNLNMPFMSAYVNVDEKHLISESGYPEWPWTTPRWTKRAREPYGRGCGHKAMRDTSMLQRSMKVQIRGVEKLVDPPLQVPDDGVFGSIRMTSAAINHVRADLLQYPGGGIRPISTGARPDIGEDFMGGSRERIERSFYNHLLQMMRDPRMTATQVIQIAEETLRVLGPMLGRMQSEDLGPMVDRVFAILQRAGAFPPPPPELDNQELKVEYVSPVAKAQRLSEARGVTQTLEVMAPIIQADPTVLDNVENDLTFRHVAELFDWPMDTLRAADRVIEIRKGRAEAAQQEAQKQDLIEGAGAAAKLLPAMAGGNGGMGAAQGGVQ